MMPREASPRTKSCAFESQATVESSPSLTNPIRPVHRYASGLVHLDSRQVRPYRVVGTPANQELSRAERKYSGDPKSARPSNLISACDTRNDLVTLETFLVLFSPVGSHARHYSPKGDPVGSDGSSSYSGPMTTLGHRGPVAGLEREGGHEASRVCAASVLLGSGVVL